MSAENLLLRLAPHRIDLDSEGRWILTRQEGTSLVVPVIYQPFFKLIADGTSLAGMARWLRSVPDVPARFTLLARFLMFLYDHELLTDSRLIELAEALRPDYVWRDSIAFEEVFALELFRFPKGEAAGGAISVVTFLLLLAAVPGVLARWPIHEIAGPWPPIENAWPVLVAFFVAVSFGRSARGLLQMALMRVMTGFGAGLKLRFDAVSVSLATDDASAAASFRKPGPFYVASSFLLLTVYLWPSLFRHQLGLPTEAAAFLTFFTAMLALADLSPFRRSAATECLRALYNEGERGGSASLRDPLIRLAHVGACVVWVIALGVFIAVPGRELLLFLKDHLAFSRPSVLVSVACLVLMMTIVFASFVDDIVSGVGDGGGDGFSVRRLWRRRLRGEPVAAAAIEAQDFAQLPLLRQMDEPARRLLLQNAEIVDVRRGEKVCRQGDSDRTLYIVIAGRLSVAKRGSSGRSRVITFLEPGAVFGEVAFFVGDRRTADVIATESGRVLAIRHDDRISDLDRGRSDEMQLRIWFLQSLVASPFFRELPSEALDALVFAGEKRVFRAGEKIINEGERGDACYFIIQGQACATQNFVAINRLKSGDAFGEIALLRPELLRTASVAADSELLTVRVDGERFWALLSSHLPLAVEIEKLAESRLRKDRERAADS